jgi:hypothetical protein
VTSFLPQDGGNISIPLDATGSTAPPGRQLVSYVWTVTNQQAGDMTIIKQQTVTQPVGASVSLPTGSYIVSLIVVDNTGRNASVVQVGLHQSHNIQQHCSI